MPLDVRYYGALTDAQSKTLEVGFWEQVGVALEADGSVSAASLNTMAAQLAAATGPVFLDVEVNVSIDDADPTYTQACLDSFKAIVARARLERPDLPLSSYAYPLHGTWFSMSGPAYDDFLADLILHKKKYVGGEWVDDPAPWYQSLDELMTSTPFFYRVDESDPDLNLEDYQADIKSIYIPFHVSSGIDRLSFHNHRIGVYLRWQYHESGNNRWPLASISRTGNTVTAVIGGTDHFNAAGGVGRATEIAGTGTALDGTFTAVAVSATDRTITFTLNGDDVAEVLATGTILVRDTWIHPGLLDAGLEAAYEQWKLGRVIRVLNWNPVQPPAGHELLTTLEAFLRRRGLMPTITPPTDQTFRAALLSILGRFTQKHYYEPWGSDPEQAQEDKLGDVDLAWDGTLGSVTMEQASLISRSGSHSALINDDDLTWNVWHDGEGNDVGFDSATPFMAVCVYKDAGSAFGGGPFGAWGTNVGWTFAHELSDPNAIATFNAQFVGETKVDIRFPVDGSIGGITNNFNMPLLMIATYDPSDRKFRLYYGATLLATSVAQAASADMTGIGHLRLGHAPTKWKGSITLAGVGIGGSNVLPTAAELTLLETLWNQTIVDPAGNGDWTTLQAALTDVKDRAGAWTIGCRKGNLGAASVTGPLACDTMTVVAVAGARASCHDLSSATMAMVDTGGGAWIDVSGLRLSGLYFAFGGCFVQVDTESLTDVVIEDCTFPGGLLLLAPGVADVRMGTSEAPISIRNCMIGGVCLSPCRGEADGTDYFEFVNCTIIGNFSQNFNIGGLQVQANAYGDGDATVTEDITLVNTLLTQCIVSATPYAAITKDATISYLWTVTNCADDDGSFSSVAGVSDQLQLASAAAQFKTWVANEDGADLTGGDYRLVKGSDLIGAGLVSPLALDDIDGTVRGADGQVCDIGCSEAGTFTQFIRNRSFRLHSMVRA